MLWVTGLIKQWKLQRETNRLEGEIRQLCREGKQNSPWRHGMDFHIEKREVAFAWGERTPHPMQSAVEDVRSDLIMLIDSIYPQYPQVTIDPDSLSRPAVLEWMRSDYYASLRRAVQLRGVIDMVEKIEAMEEEERKGI